MSPDVSVLLLLGAGALLVLFLWAVLLWRERGYGRGILSPEQRAQAVPLSSQTLKAVSRPLNAPLNGAEEGGYTPALGVPVAEERRE